MKKIEEMEKEAPAVNALVEEFAAFLIHQGFARLTVAVALQAVSVKSFYEECKKDLPETKELIKLVTDRIEQELTK